MPGSGGGIHGNKATRTPMGMRANATIKANFLDASFQMAASILVRRLDFARTAGIKQLPVTLMDRSDGAQLYPSSPLHPIENPDKSE